MSSPFTTTMARGAGTMARGAGGEVIAGSSLPSGAGLSPCEHEPRTLGKCRALARHDIYRNFGISPEREVADELRRCRYSCPQSARPRDGRPLYVVGGHQVRVVIMFAVYAARTDASNPLNGLETGERPDPEPPAGWATVTVKATALNHHDVWSLRGVGLAADRLPMILGCDAAGVDAEGNEVVVHGVIGDANAGGGDETLDPRRSLLSERYQGTFAEKVMVPKANLIPKPAALSFEEAACLPTAYLTAYKMLFDKSGVQPGSTILVQGAGGGVATALILLGRAAGYRMWVTSRTEAKRDAALKLGADQAFATGARLPERVDVVMETVGQATWSHSVRSLKPGGRIVISGATSGDIPPAELTRIFFTQLSVVGSTMGTRDQLGRLLRFCEQTGTRPLIDRAIPLSAARDGFAAMISGTQTGKIVFVP
jgi:NADPH:quinone reductase-like Zn-dependent oxidoreductase